MLIEALVIIMAYLLGSIPSALIVGKLGYGIDIREHGSGNLGGTNTFRTLGKKAGLIVTGADILKGTLAASLPILLSSELHPLFVGLFAVIGHVYPVFAKFKGGKAVATSGGLLLFYNPILFITMLVVFFICLYLTKYVSLSSMLTGIYGVIYSLFYGDIALIIVLSFLTAFVIFKHIANIKRIFNKTEPKIKWL
ncbi:glycerol-3-phosphate 1-O-acyltransferase PlsY [Cytobacillus sp. S13-E01]|uniref:glycerol-3-phosphate 1-O-acyltransferase PlsY n=1 Tax=Cytobacillus sp. S13-E01 TaxID=3031326 RepID=UPI0023D80651|nr:glycerol-3-phosphate 1-O-acyltransferase PlsY [Cytobacillus sp. S13-E01]MDF0727990.1 glycerol-3-phosphate 1-O-acyltransferase PlsY [Cytobacillus sp. S13-E01]